MMLPDAVHSFSLDFEFHDREMTVHPSTIETDNGLLLLDAGHADAFDQLEAGIDGCGFDVEAVSTVLISHEDGDHAGGLAALRKRTNATVVCHELTAPVVDGRQSTRGPDDAGRYPPAHVDLELSGPATLNTDCGPLHVIPTPGHTEDHVSFVLPDEQLLIAADALTVEDGALAGPLPELTEDMEEARRSITELSEFDIEHTLCYHGGFIDAGSEELAAVGER